MKFVLVAGDFAQSEVLRTLGEKLAERGHSVAHFLSFGKKDVTFAFSIGSAIEWADVVVAGMSENSANEVEAAKIAVEKDTKIVLYADTYDTHASPEFESLRGFDKLTIFVINDHEAAKARPLFPHANIEVTGNPRWEEFAFPKSSRDEIRRRFEITEDERMILCVGDKYLAQNMIQIGATIDAIQKLGWENNTQLFIALHPGDLNDPKLYEPLAGLANCDATYIIGKNTGITSSEILVGCDLVVEFTSTVGIEAACLRIPLIDFCSTVALRGKKPTVGKTPWNLVEYGASLPVYFGSTDALAQTMLQIEDTMVGGLLREAQARMFPVPSAEDRGQALRLMCQALGA